MLDASDQERLRQIEANLLAEDPTFVARMRGETEATPHHWRASLAVLGGFWLLWVLTLFGVSTFSAPVVAANAVVVLVLATVAWRMTRRRRRLRPFVVG